MEMPPVGEVMAILIQRWQIAVPISIQTLPESVNGNIHFFQGYHSQWPPELCGKSSGHDFVYGWHFKDLKSITKFKRWIEEQKDNLFFKGPNTDKDSQ
ncbi:hypothetical protein AAF712_016172, partial [Marasmius tenuissimus]